MTAPIISIDDLNDGAIDAILQQAGIFADRNRAYPHSRFVVGLLFLSPSLRTRTGYAIAAARLGGQSVSVETLRFDGAMSAAESVEDSVRTLSGMTDLLVVRASNVDLRGVAASAACPLINGGDAREHPTQALIDLFVIEKLKGPIEELRIGICGDLQMRAVSSLLLLFCRRRPKHIRLMTPLGREISDTKVQARLGDLADTCCDPNFADLDVLYLAGLPERRGGHVLDVRIRRSFALTADSMATLPAAAIVLNPLPMIDEIDGESRADPRVRVFEQSDLGLYVRMAVIRHGLNIREA